MQVVNDVGRLCPKALLRAAQESLYRPQEDVIRVSELVDSPLIRRLRMKHWDDLRINLTRMLPALDGTAWHSMMEHYSGADTSEMSEYRMFWNFDIGNQKVTLTGQIDSYMRDTKVLGDYKRIPAIKWVKNNFDDFEAKQNIYRQMLIREGYQVDRLILWCLIKDWSKYSQMSSQDYPPRRLSIKNLRIWTKEEVEEYIQHRLRLHFVEDGAVCTPDEKWQHPTTYALKKAGRKTAVKVEESMASLEAYIESKNEDSKSKISIDGKTYWVEARPGECVRCGDWCEVNQYCPYFQSMKVIEELGEHSEEPTEYASY